jgi:hypothetical protein
LFSGISKSNDEIIEDVPVDHAPFVSEIIITYYDSEVKYLFADIQDFDETPRQLVLYSNTDISGSTDASVDTGLSLSESAVWDDFSEAARLAKKNGGKILLPILSGTVDNNIIQPLDFNDGYEYSARYGGWDPDNEVVVYDSNGVVVDYTSYRIFSAAGKIVFRTRQTSQFYLSLIPPDKVKIGVKVTNFDDKNVVLSGLGYLYSRSTR